MNKLYQAVDLLLQRHGWCLPPELSYFGINGACYLVDGDSDEKVLGLRVPDRVMTNMFIGYLVTYYNAQRFTDGWLVYRGQEPTQPNRRFYDNPNKLQSLYQACRWVEGLDP